LGTTSGRIILVLLILVVAIFVCCVVPVKLIAEQGRVVPHHLTIFFSGDDNGNVKPCG